MRAAGRPDVAKNLFNNLLGQAKEPAEQLVITQQVVITFWNFIGHEDVTTCANGNGTTFLDDFAVLGGIINFPFNTAGFDRVAEIIA